MKNLRAFLLALFFSIIIIQVTPAQSGSDVHIEQIGNRNLTDVEQISLDWVNRAIMLQYGVWNVGILKQVNMGGLSSENYAYIMQNGAHNFAMLMQFGSGNSSNIEQIGNHNYYFLMLQGNNNTTNVYQQGNNNYVSQNLQTSNSNFSVTQVGNNNTFIQVESSLSMSGYEVRQIGEGARLVILNGGIMR